MTDSRVERIVSGTVARISTRFSGGVQLEEQPETWFNGSKFTKVLPDIADLELGEKVTLGLDKAGYIREVESGVARPATTSVDTSGLDEDTAKLVRKAAAKKAAAAVAVTETVTVTEPEDVSARITRAVALKLGVESARARTEGATDEEFVKLAIAYAEQFRPYLSTGATE